MQPASHTRPSREVRASYSDSRIVVYQAFKPSIADAAVIEQAFVPPFSRTRMTWIKPSFLWCCYRSGWAQKPGQERMLAITISRAGLHAALEAACLASYDAAVHGSQQIHADLLRNKPNRVQWDPERNLTLQALPDIRSLQLGLGPAQVLLYVDHWVTQIEDVTPLARTVQRLVATRQFEQARAALPVARTYPLPLGIKKGLGAT